MGTERNLVELIGDEFVRRVKLGENPSICEYENRHPEIADEVRAFLEAMQVVHKFKGGSSNSSSGSYNRPRNDAGFPEIADYQVVREIGRGGMGVVYEARQKSLDRVVALKVLPEIGGGTEKAKKRFQIEARAAAKLNHANIVPVRSR